MPPLFILLVKVVIRVEQAYTFRHTQWTGHLCSPAAWACYILRKFRPMSIWPYICFIFPEGHAYSVWESEMLMGHANLGMCSDTSITCNKNIPLNIH